MKIKEMVLEYTDKNNVKYTIVQAGNLCKIKKANYEIQDENTFDGLVEPSILMSMDEFELEDLYDTYHWYIKPNIQFTIGLGVLTEEIFEYEMNKRQRRQKVYDILNEEVFDRKFLIS
ncbi:hypothetical protein GCM10008904_32520 [Paraclostridium ghonii]|uniref:Uncharacterized protein n=1 Tax=Paraclostridium ghonii TaxID=29358 RepID=A0ABU0MWQ8_9FIRM|nr:hypothetical protein [Paeniclostridium ghonii]MDQ0555343.1 hypothetical protein [Paeniclostridium ghonii]